MKEPRTWTRWAWSDGGSIRVADSTVGSRGEAYWLAGYFEEVIRVTITEVIPEATP